MSDKTKVLAVQFTDTTGEPKTLYFTAPTVKHVGKEAAIIEQVFATAPNEKFAVRQLMIFGFKPVEIASPVQVESTFNVSFPALAAA